MGTVTDSVVVGLKGFGKLWLKEKSVGTTSPAFFITRSLLPTRTENLEGFVNGLKR
jgi:hypothetical protein